MTIGNKVLLAAGFVAVFGLGVWVRPYLDESRSNDLNLDTTRTHGVSVEAPAVKPADIVIPAARSAPRETSAIPTSPKVLASAPELHKRLKPLLNKGANMTIAADGFRSAEQFATLAHASQNVDVPFMLLKHRVLDDGSTLAAAIKKSKPHVDATAEVKRAQSEARSDIQSLN